MGSSVVSPPDWLAHVPRHASFSQYSSWAECNFKYIIGRVIRPPEVPAWWFIGGTAFHEATADWDEARSTYGSDLYGAESLIALFLHKIDAGIAEATEREPDRRKWRMNKAGEDERFYRGRARSWCESYAQDASDTVLYEIDGKPAIELKFEVELGGAPVQGAIDRVLVRPTGELLVRDLKTGKSDGDDQQLGLYSVVLGMAFGLHVFQGDFWNPRKRTQNPPIALHYTKDYWDRAIAGFESQRRSGKPVPSRGRHCSWCEFQPICPAFPENKEPINL